MYEIELSPPFNHNVGKCWIAVVPITGDSSGKLDSPMILKEDGKPLGEGHQTHQTIADTGQGFSHWGKEVYFATSDGTDPNTNGRSYTAEFPVNPSEAKAARDEMMQSKTPVDKDTLVKFLGLTSGDKDYEVYSNVEPYAMIHEDVLALYGLIAARAPGRILEVGAYIGGGTAALASFSDEPVITIEPGGAYPDHPFLPSDNILRDFRHTLSVFGVTKNVELIPSYSDIPEAIEWLDFKLKGEKATVLVIDADGNLERDLRIFYPKITDDCLLVFDDYVIDHSMNKDNTEVHSQGVDKDTLVKPIVDKLIQTNQVEDYGVYGHGTWFGRAKGVLDLSVLD